MSFSANWGNADNHVRAESVTADLALEKGQLSPPLESMADDVRVVVEEAARAAADLVLSLDSGKGAAYRVNAGGHVRQGENDTGTVSVSVAEIVCEPAKAEDASDEATTGSDAAIADEQMGPL